MRQKYYERRTIIKYLEAAKLEKNEILHELNNRETTIMELHEEIAKLKDIIKELGFDYIIAKYDLEIGRLKE